MEDTFREPTATGSSEIIAATKYIVKGPVNTTYRYGSFEEANFAYMNQNFPGWQQSGQTFVIPPCFKDRGDQWMGVSILRTGPSDRKFLFSNQSDRSIFRTGAKVYV